MADTEAVLSPPYKRHRFPPEIIAYEVWLHYRFALSFRDVEELLASKGDRQLRSRAVMVL